MWPTADAPVATSHPQELEDDFACAWRVSLATHTQWVARASVALWRFVWDVIGGDSASRGLPQVDPPYCVSIIRHCPCAHMTHRARPPPTRTRSHDASGGGGHEVPANAARRRRVAGEGEDTGAAAADTARSGARLRIQLRGAVPPHMCARTHAQSDRQLLRLLPAVRCAPAAPRRLRDHDRDAPPPRAPQALRKAVKKFDKRAHKKGAQGISSQLLPEL